MMAADVVPLSTVHAAASARDASRAAPASARVRFSRFELDEANALLLCDGSDVALAPRPFKLLCALARQPGSLLTKNALLDEVWGHRFVSDSALKTTVSDLRMVLGDDPRNPRCIQTVSRRGYRFVAATTVASAAPSARDTPMGEIGFDLSPPAFATMEDMRCARELWLQLTALILGQRSPQAEPMAVGAH
jgi:DNA-binding winged helix-turn-helix (wHTH) protein